MKASRFGLAMCVLLLFSACSLKPTWDVVGKWQKADSNEVIEFSRNGTVTISGGAVSMSAGYRFLNSKQLEFNLGSLGSYDVKAHIEDSTMRIVDAKGHETEFKKIK